MLKVPLHGIGEDCFYLNESLPTRKNILHFETLRAFDEFDYRLQEEARRKEDANYAGKPYRGSLYMNWARLYVEGRFAYATLSMACGDAELRPRRCITIRWSLPCATVELPRMAEKRRSGTCRRSN